MMKKNLVFMLVLSCAACTFDNDMSYPIVEAEFISLSVEGAESVEIDKENRSVEIVLDEISELTSVKVFDYQVTEGAEVVGGFPSVLDLSSPRTFILRTYQDYEWTISASQPVERYVRVDNQISETCFDLEAKVAIVYVADNQNLQEITFNSMKLEREGTQIVSTSAFLDEEGTSVGQEMEVSFPMILNCELPRYFDMKYKGEDIRWVVKVVQEQVDMKITSVNPWATRVSVKGVYDQDGIPQFQYKKVQDQEWVRFEEVQTEGVDVSAEIVGLQSDTDYQIRIICGEESSSVYEFRTEAAAQLYNFSFDQWHKSGKVWYPYPEDASSNQIVWDSANKGAATFIGSSTIPDDDFSVSGNSVRMESRYALIAFAAGNLYTGQFGKIVGIGAELDWGTPFTSRPTSLKGYYSYTPKIIDRVKPPYEDMKGQMDKCQILVLLTDWDEPFKINTTAGEFVDIETDPGIIAHAVMESDQATDGFVEFNLPLQYRDLERKPKYVVIACCASYLGDYFTGGEGSLMYVDEFEFVY